MSNAMIPPSPLAQQSWLTVSQMKADLMTASPASINTAVKLLKTGGRVLTTQSRETRLQKREHRCGGPPTHEPARCILALLDRDIYRSKRTNASLTSMWQVRWRDRKTIRVEWMERSKMTKIFGSEEAKVAVREYCLPVPVGETGESL